MFTAILYETNNCKGKDPAQSIKLRPGNLHRQESSLPSFSNLVLYIFFLVFTVLVI